MVYLRNILVTTDLSEYSLAAMEHAATFSLLYAAKLHLLYVTDVDAKEFQRVGEAAARNALQEFVAKHVNPDTRLIPVVRRGTPADEIIKFAEEEGMDLVVVATHGRTGLKHMVMGSVAERIVRRSTIPVLTVKPHPMRESILMNEDVEHELHLR